MKYMVNGEVVEFQGDHSVQVSRQGDRLWVRTPAGSQSAVAIKHAGKIHISYAGRTYAIEPFIPGVSKSGPVGSGELRAPMPGQIVEVCVVQGDAVVAGQKVLVLEAMKMQQPMVAGFDGIVGEISVVKGDQVADGQLLARLLPG